MGKLSDSALRVMAQPAAATKATILERLDEVIGRLAAHGDRHADALADLQRRIERLEAREDLSYHGTFDTSEPYPKNAAVTHSGCLWIARRATTGDRPGSGDAWQLAVRKGRDAR